MYIGILGGSFNPVHIGHVRLAIEILECKLLPFPLNRIDLIPCSIPPHKPNASILPFNLRLELLKAATANTKGININPLENERSGPSYTWDTLNIYKQNNLNNRLLFIVGGEDFAAIPNWFRGLELPKLADIGMVPRAGNDINMFQEQIKQNWPSAQFENNVTLTANLEYGTKLLYLPIPRLDISASFIRQRWCNGQNIQMLLPDNTLNILNNARNEVHHYWKNKEN